MTQLHDWLSATLGTFLAQFHIIEVVIALAVATFIAKCTDSIIYQPRHLDARRLAREDSPYSEMSPTMMAGLCSFSAIAIGLWHLVSTYQHSSNDILPIVAYIVFVVAGLKMISIDVERLKALLEFRQWCHRQKYEDILSWSMDEATASDQKGRLPTGRDNEKQESTGDPQATNANETDNDSSRLKIKLRRFLLPTFSYVELMKKLSKDKALSESEENVLKLLTAVGGRRTASNIVRYSYITSYVAFCMLFPMLLVLYHTDVDDVKTKSIFYTLTSGVDEAAIILFRPTRAELDQERSAPTDVDAAANGSRDTLAAQFKKAEDPAYNATMPSTSGLSKAVRFLFFFFLILAPIRYIWYIVQYQVLKEKGGHGGLGLEIDAVSKMGTFGVVLAALFLALIFLNVDFGELGLMTGFVAAGLSIAMRDTLGNLMAGMQLIWDGSLKKGDVISIPSGSSSDTGSTYGIVEQVRMRYTVVQDRNTVRRLIPNHHLTGDAIEHWTHEDNKIRLNLRIGVSYDAGKKLRETQKILESVCYDVPRVLTEKPPQALLVDFADSALVFSLRFWLSDAKEGIRPVISQIMINAYERLLEEGITIPFPQRDLHIKPSEEHFKVLLDDSRKLVDGQIEGPNGNAKEV